MTQIHCARPLLTSTRPFLLGERAMVNLGKSSRRLLGDWVCTRCGYYNYARQTRCRACQAANATTMALGDWLC